MDTKSTDLPEAKLVEDSVKRLQLLEQKSKKIENFEPIC